MIVVKLLKPWQNYAKDSQVPAAPDFAVQLVNLGIAEIYDPKVKAQLQALGKLPKDGEPEKKEEPKPPPAKPKKETHTPKTYRRKKST